MRSDLAEENAAGHVIEIHPHEGAGQGAGDPLGARYEIARMPGAGEPGLVAVLVADRAEFTELA